MTGCQLAVGAWGVVIGACVGFGFASFLMWLWFVVLGKGDWS